MKKEFVEKFIKENNETIKKMNKEKETKAIIDNLNDERVATLVEKETLQDKEIINNCWKSVIKTQDVKKFIQEFIDELKVIIDSVWPLYERADKLAKQKFGGLLK